MRKVIKSATVCEHCGSTLKGEEYEEFCDVCQKKIPKGIDLDITTFFREHDNTQRNQFCSWECVKSFLTNYPYNKAEVRFITLPYITELETVPFHEQMKVFLDSMLGEKEARK